MSSECERSREKASSKTFNSPTKICIRIWMIETWKHAIKWAHCVCASPFGQRFSFHRLIRWTPSPHGPNTHTHRAVIQHKCKHLNDFQCNLSSMHTKMFALPSLSLTLSRWPFHTKQKCKKTHKKEIENPGWMKNGKISEHTQSVAIRIKMVNKVHYPLV